MASLSLRRDVIVITVAMLMCFLLLAQKGKVNKNDSSHICFFKLGKRQCERKTLS